MLQIDLLSIHVKCKTWGKITTYTIETYKLYSLRSFCQEQRLIQVHDSRTCLEKLFGWISQEYVRSQNNRQSDIWR